MKRDRKFAKNRKCNDPMNFKGGGFNVTLFDDRLWKLSSPSEQLEKNTLLGVKRHSITNVKFKSRPFIDNLLELLLRKDILPLPCDSLSSTRSNTREIPSASSIRLETRHPFLTPSKRSPFRSPDFCLNYPRFEPWKGDCNETLFLPPLHRVTTNPSPSHKLLASRWSIENVR